MPEIADSFVVRIELPDGGYNSSSRSPAPTSTTTYAP
jgi:hypothetical protein